MTRLKPRHWRTPVAIIGDGRPVETGSVAELRDELVERSLLKNLAPG